MMQALTDETNNFKKDLEDEKKSKAEAEKTKATAEGNLAMTVKELAKGTKDYGELQHDCMQKSGDHEATVAGRSSELQAITSAKKIVQSQMGSAASAAALDQTDESSFTFLQMSSTSRRKSREQIAGQHVVALVQKLAAKQKSDSLKKLASRISAVIRYGLNGRSRDPFAKVKNLLTDMIRKLEREQKQDGTEQEYCTREMKKTKENREELIDTAEGLKAKIDQAASESTKLKSQAKDL